MSFRSLVRVILPIAAVMLVTLAVVFGARYAAELPPPITRQPGAPPLLEPESGVYYGVNLDWVEDSPGTYDTRLGRRAAVFVQFFQFPLTDAGQANLDSMIAQVGEVHGIALITLEPNNGLAAITQADANDLAVRMATINAAGVPVFIRFAHEMNGSWYPWCQQPEAYVRTFRMIATAIHTRAPQTAMMWAPNYGGEYPFSGGKYEAKPGTPDFALLDTDGDGALTADDNPYEPYYPGDDAVDWVGMSLYHWGSAHPWGENEMPEPGKFVAQLTGTYDGLGGNHIATPDFYHVYYEFRHKPIAITETAALYQPGEGGADELAMKQAWWRQVFNAATLRSHPGIRMINWFEHLKPETEIGGANIDWRATGSPVVLDAYRADLPTDLLIFAP